MNDKKKKKKNWEERVKEIEVPESLKDIFDPMILLNNIHSDIDADLNLVHSESVKVEGDSLKLDVELFDIFDKADITLKMDKEKPVINIEANIIGKSGFLDTLVDYDFDDLEKNFNLSDSNVQREVSFDLANQEYNVKCTYKDVINLDEVIEDSEDDDPVFKKTYGSKHVASEVGKVYSELFEICNEWLISLENAVEDQELNPVDFDDDEDDEDDEDEGQDFDDDEDEDEGQDL